jgi:hypothetical protein
MLAADRSGLSKSIRGWDCAHELSYLYIHLVFIRKITLRSNPHTLSLSANMVITRSTLAENPAKPQTAEAPQNLVSKSQERLGRLSSEYGPSSKRYWSLPPPYGASFPRQTQLSIAVPGHSENELSQAPSISHVGDQRPLNNAIV